jgi:hypothetical protein
VSRFFFYILSSLLLLVIFVNSVIYIKFSSIDRSFSKGLASKGIFVRHLRNKSASLESLENGTENLPTYVLRQVSNLENVISNYFMRIKNGTDYVLALPFDFVQSKDSYVYSLLTFYPLEWKFAKLNIQGFSFYPKYVLYCNGFFLISYKLKGVFPRQIEKGNLNEYGIIAVPVSQNKVELKPFDSNKGCLEDGFVFNLDGDFSGICTGDKFLSTQEIYDLLNSTCKLIYGEGDYGDL